jgi:hypothetical protein
MVISAEKGESRVGSSMGGRKTATVVLSPPAEALPAIISDD